MKSKKEKYVYSVFQSIAGGYDRANRRISLLQHLSWKKKAADVLCDPLPEGAEIVDIGCGTGDMLLSMAKKRPDFVLTGLDFSPNMLKVAKERLKKVPDVKLIRGNALDMPFEDKSFDGGSISFALRNTADYRKALSEAYRVLKNGGRFVCIDSFVPENRLIKPFYEIYFSVLMPLLGGGIKKLKQYRWLTRSTADFISAAELAKLMKSVGFTGIRVKEFMLGACVMVSGRVERKFGYKQKNEDA